MADPRAQLNEMLQFKPEWWWDPVPFWYLDKIDDRILHRFAAIQVQLEQSILNAKAKANRQVMEILKEMDVG